MIISIRRRLTIAAHDDRGMSLPEVLVAMVIFAIISSGLLYTMLSVLALGRDSRAREVALNLAAEEIDISRGFADVFALQDATRSLDLNGDTFTVDRTTRWVSDPEIDLQCGSGGAPLRYNQDDVYLPDLIVCRPAGLKARALVVRHDSRSSVGRGP